jgi:hypothetical protein
MAQEANDQPQVVPAPVEAPEESKATGPLDNEAATSAFEQALGPHPDSPQQATPEIVEEAQVEEAPQDDDKELQLRDSEDEQSDEGSGSDPLDQLIEIAGEKKTAKEWKEAQMRHSDYTKKTQMVAQEKKELESIKQQTSQMREHYAASLGLITKAAQDDVNQFEGVDWQYMAETNPQDYIKYKAAYDMSRERLQKVNNEATSFFNAVDVESRKGIEQKAMQCIDELRGTFKNWNNETYYNLVEYGMESGMDRDLLLNCTDPGVFKALYKARMYDKGKTVKTEPKAGLSPSTVNSGRNAKGQYVAKKGSALDKLRKTGHRSDGVDAFKELLGG